MDGRVRAGTKENGRAIVEAIRTLKRLEESGELPTSSEREVLSKFTGFGAVATKIFPNPATGSLEWQDLGAELKGLLTEVEYASAKATTFTAFYTSPLVMREMHRGLARLGVSADSVGLEPGCGIGNFIGCAPDDMSFIGVEQDSISGRIARLLYPEHDIRIAGFQDVSLPDGSIDFAIGNVPFADIKLRYGKERHSLHDYFFLKSLDAVRPGDALAFVTSRYTMDKADATVRRMLCQKADFIGAMRLPGEAFKDQGTRVVTDVIFLRKKPLHQEESPSWSPTSWLSTSDDSDLLPGMRVNDYFLDNPQMVLGQMSVGSGMHGRASLRVRSDGELAAALHAAIDGLPEGICSRSSATRTLDRSDPVPRSKAARQVNTAFPYTGTSEARTSADEVRSHAAHELNSKAPHERTNNLKEGSFLVAPDKRIMQVEGGRLAPVMRADKEMRANGTMGAKRLAGLIVLRDLAREVLRTQQEGEALAKREAARTRLQKAYRSFTSKYGPINKTTFSERQDGTVVRRMPNLLRFNTDPDVYLVMALELYDERTGKAKPAAIMERDVVTPLRPATSVDTAKDGLLACLNELGRVDLAYIHSLYARSEEEIVGELGELIFFDPALETHVPADEYLSGDVRSKLRLVESSSDPRVRGNAEALKRVQPEDLVAEEIDVTLGTPWIPADDVKQFLVEMLGIPPASCRVEYVGKEALWKVRAGSEYLATAAATSEFGTKDIHSFALVEQALNMRTPTVRVRIPGGPGESDTYVVDQEATLAAREKQGELKARFSDWIFQKPERSKRLVRFYNDNFNNIRLREFDGAHLTFPRMSAAIQMRPHQKDAIWRSMSSGNTLLAHRVGAGKTFTMVASGMEMVRTGLAKKPVYVVPNHMLEQFSREFLLLYPDANILVATKNDLGKKRRQLLKAKMATNQWDGIVMTHSSFEKIAMSPSYQEQFLRDQLEEYEELITTVVDDSIKRNLTKKIEKLKAARSIKLGEMAASERKDDGLFFDELGIDLVFVDEAHMFKNLETPTKMDRVAGIQTGGSNRAFDLLMKSRYLASRTPGRGLVFATGTPVSNSLGEMYTMMRYLMPDRLRERGIEHFDAWAAAFGEVINALEISPDGKNLRVNTRFARFKNIPELLSIFRLFADVQTGSTLKLAIPEIKGGKAEITSAPMSMDQLDYQESLVDRYERVRSSNIDPRQDNALKIVTDGRKLALDGRLIDPLADDLPDSKVNQLVDKVYEIWDRTKENRSTQMIFSDLGVSKTEWGFCVYDDVIEKLIARGVPADEIANIGEANTDQKKESLFSSVRAGQVRVLLGSTIKMGTGTNVQSKLYALHHLDPPWRPADIEQREGRILRQGNSHKEVEVYRYVTEGSFDAYMWQTLETKAKFIAQAMSGDAGTRRADDIGAAELSFAEVKAIASGNPAMLVLAEMELDLRQLTLLRRAHLRDQGEIREKLETLPKRITQAEARITELEADVARRRDTRGDVFSMTVDGRQVAASRDKTLRQSADLALALAVARASNEIRSSAASATHERYLNTKIGELGGLDVILESRPHAEGNRFRIMIEGSGSYQVAQIDSPKSCPPLVQKLEHRLKSLDRDLAAERASLSAMNSDLARYQERKGASFASEDSYQALGPMRDRLKQLLRIQENEPARDKDEGPSTSEEIETLIGKYRALSTEKGEIKPSLRGLDSASGTAHVVEDSRSSSAQASDRGDPTPRSDAARQRGTVERSDLATDGSAASAAHERVEEPERSHLESNAHVAHAHDSKKGGNPDPRPLVNDSREEEEKNARREAQSSYRNHESQRDERRNIRDTKRRNSSVSGRTRRRAQGTSRSQAPGMQGHQMGLFGLAEQGAASTAPESTNARAFRPTDTSRPSTAVLQQETREERGSGLVTNGSAGLAPPESDPGFRTNARDWLSSLPDDQIKEAASFAGKTSAEDMIQNLAPHYERPSLLEDLINHDVSAAQPFGRFIRDLREEGKLENLDGNTIAHARQCYHTLIAAELGADLESEQARRKALWESKVEEAARRRNSLTNQKEAIMANNRVHNYSVIQSLVEKAYAWEDNLTPREVEEMIEVLGMQDHQLSNRPGVLAVADMLKGVCRNDEAMQKILVEGIGRFAPFDTLLDDVRLGAWSADQETLQGARNLYNAALAERMGVSVNDDEVAPVNPRDFLERKAASWAAGLPDYKVEEVASRADIPVYPRDLEEILTPYYNRPDLLKALIKQSVEAVRPFGECLKELRNWGELDHLGTQDAGRARRCYNALMAAGLGLDMEDEVRRRTERRAATITPRGIISALADHYSAPESIEGALLAALADGKQVGEFLASLRLEGDLAPLRAVEMDSIRRDYHALAIRESGRVPSQGHREPTRTRRNMQRQNTQDPHRRVHGRWTAQVAGQSGQASQEVGMETPAG